MEDQSARHLGKSSSKWIFINPTVSAYAGLTLGMLFIVLFIVLVAFKNSFEGWHSLVYPTTLVVATVFIFWGVYAADLQARDAFRTVLQNKIMDADTVEFNVAKYPFIFLLIVLALIYGTVSAAIIVSKVPILWNVVPVLLAVMSVFVLIKMYRKSKILVGKESIQFYDWLKKPIHIQMSEIDRINVYAYGQDYTPPSTLELTNGEKVTLPMLSEENMMKMIALLKHKNQNIKLSLERYSYFD